MRVEITLKSGATVAFCTENISKRVSPITETTRLVWTTHQDPGVPSLLYLEIDEVAAVVTYASMEVSGGEDERDAEAAQAGGDEVEPGRDVGGGDTEQDGRQ